MIIIAGTLKVKAEMQAQALALFQTMAESTRTVTGCMGYNVYLDPRDDGRLFIFEQWEDDAALQAHGWSPQMAEFRRQRAPLIAGEVDIRRYEVTDVREA